MLCNAFHVLYGGSVEGLLVWDGARTESRTSYTGKPGRSLYSKGLLPPKDSLRRLPFYQRIYWLPANIIRRTLCP